MSRRLKTDIPGPDWRVSIDDARERGFAKVFAGRVAHPLPLVVEIGFGRGEFLLELAQRSPEQAFVGIELSYKRTLKMARRVAKLALANVALVEGRAEEVLGDALALLARRLVPGGLLRIATDDPDYAAWIDAHLADVPELENCYAPERWRPAVADRPATAYELEWRALGRSLHFFHYAKKA